MEKLTLETLTAACRAGGPSVLTSVTALSPAAGPHAAVSPAKFVSGRSSAFSYFIRFVNGSAQHAVLIDSKQSQLNRCEEQIAAAIADGHAILSRTPRIRVTYSDQAFTDIELPHRAFDGHIRAGSIDGAPATKNPIYREARNASKTNARALLELSPGSLVFGSWDSSRASNQGRYQSALSGEIIGFLADQSGAEATDPPRKGGARVDPVGMSVQLTGDQMTTLIDAQEDELSPKTVTETRAQAKKAKGATLSGSTLGLGGVPPTLESLGGVSCSRIVRSHVLSFAALRQLRFGAGPEGDAACRALLAAYALNGLARSDSELLLRADCHLVEDGAPVVTLDQRHGNSVTLEPLTIPEADELLAAAIQQAESTAGISWDGEVLHVVGNPEVHHAAEEESDE
ncbi:type I-U CRISPR-associated RAMP protein Csb1/Cas7u [Brevibacterium sp. R8603A2]|uniref:type I-G CRISPR-associated RAMP protein Csb1/Cas7g n=1 Tax=Brevibacterium TaxID=1696 RepID=UPI000C7590C4|nr:MULTISPECIES: type I-U CRISPR-associated RAMP protein Csb1/Cas7u [Brevibacterium]MCK1803032.1 type I-U CRISPR-associated RAMP protein Csb1/Cas7u [Brevibacterium sp. R8603A2]